MVSSLRSNKKSPFFICLKLFKGPVLRKYGVPRTPNRSQPEIRAIFWRNKRETVLQFLLYYSGSEDHIGTVLDMSYLYFTFYGGGGGKGLCGDCGGIYRHSVNLCLFFCIFFDGLEFVGQSILYFWETSGFELRELHFHPNLATHLSPT